MKSPRRAITVYGLTLYPILCEDGLFGPTGGELWPASELLAQRLPDSEGLIVEVGAGLGLPGLRATLMGHRVLRTDYDELVVENLRRQIRDNDLTAVATTISQPSRQRSHSRRLWGRHRQHDRNVPEILHPSVTYCSGNVPEHYVPEHVPEPKFGKRLTSTAWGFGSRVQCRPDRSIDRLSKPVRYDVINKLASRAPRVMARRRSFF